MRFLFLPFFLTQLGLVLLPFFLKAFWLYKKGWIQMSLFVAFLSVQLWMVVKQLGKTTQFTLIPTAPSPTPLPYLNAVPDSSLQTVSLSSSELSQEQNNWEEYLRLQPNHRDILLNLSLLATYTNQPAQAQEYFNRARSLDPNHPLFSTANQETSH